MFVNLVHFPPIKEGKDAQFREWFVWSNEKFATQEGFIRRLLLKPRRSGNYVAIVEHESQETFVAMEASTLHAEVHKEVAPILEGNPVPNFYEVIVQ